MTGLTVRPSTVFQSTTGPARLLRNTAAAISGSRAHYGASAPERSHHQALDRRACRAPRAPALSNQTSARLPSSDRRQTCDFLGNVENMMGEASGGCILHVH